MNEFLDSVSMLGVIIIAALNVMKVMNTDDPKKVILIIGIILPFFSFLWVAGMKAISLAFR